MHTATALAVLCATAVALEARPLAAQAVSTSPQGGDAPSIFAPLTLVPAPSATRLATGAPGPKYWQNRADYDLKATLDTATQSVRGSMTLRYTNNSPDLLPVLWFQTEQDGEVLDRFDQVVGAKSMSLIPQHPGGDVYETEVTLAEPLKPGATATLRLEWHFHVPKPNGNMGHLGTLYEVAQWYPRLNVYDDVKGWNTESFATGAEFFVEYGDYQFEVTLPAGYIVAATGTLDNPQTVLTAAEIARLAQAAKADTVVRIITAAELTSGAARPTQTGMLTWRFHANNVRDAVWCASPEYQWDATQWNGRLAQAYYRPEAVATWSDAADMARMSIQEYSERWMFPYPYPQVSVVEGPVEGEEYPMLSMDQTGSTRPNLYSTITHEVGHNWFPMIVGSNERMHTWMDEGFNQFINSFSEARRYPAEGDQETRIAAYGGYLKNNSDNAVLENGTAIGNTVPQYFKTAAVLQMLRRDVLGPDVFDKGFRMYIQRWAYKHPTPMDFFRTMEDVSGRKLDWFWREWFLEAPIFDQSIDSVHQTVQGTDTHVTVTYGNKGRVVMPLLVRFTFSDGTTQNIVYPADVWKANPTMYTVSYTFSKQTVTRISLDPKGHLPDADRTNNSWTAR